jgi:hypothetical protein
VTDDPAPDVTGGPVPDDVRALADARAMARAGRDWSEADRLRSEIEAAGWTIVDRGFSYRLARAHAPDIEIAGRMLYGRSDAVPSRLGEPATTAASIIVVGADDPDPLDRTVAALRRTDPPDTQVVLVGNGPSPEVDALLQRLAVVTAGEAAPGRPPPTDPVALDGAVSGPLEVLGTSVRLGWPAAVNAGLRRATGNVVILLDPGLEPSGDIVTALESTLSDPAVGVVGAWGSVTEDLRRYQAAPPGEVDVVDGACLAFRRVDLLARGPLDERFRTRRHLDAWWSLTLRDEGDGATPRRAIRVADLPIERTEGNERPLEKAAEHDRAEKRDFYRLLERFRARPDLHGGGAPDAR